MIEMATIAEIRSPMPVDTPWALKDLPPYRPVARKLMMLTAKADVPLDEVQKVLRADAAFTGDVLRIANSPIDRFPRGNQERDAGRHVTGARTHQGLVHHPGSADISYDGRSQRCVARLLAA